MRVGKTAWAIAFVESSLRRGAKRYEPAFRARYVEPQGLPDEEARWRATSWGLWQLMGQVLVELGYRYRGEVEFEERFLSDPEVQWFFAGKLWARNVKQIGRTAPTWRRVEAWNKGAGGAKRLEYPSEYYDKVTAAAAHFTNGEL